jgi:hypothetical protein
MTALPDMVVGNVDADAVFIATPGAPVETQADWVDDTGLSDTEFWRRVDNVLAVAGPPRAGAASGWAPDELAQHGLEVNPRGHVRCRYGCGGTTSNVAGVSHHHYSCAYWSREGATNTPF